MYVLCCLDTQFKLRSLNAGAQGVTRVGRPPPTENPIVLSYNCGEGALNLVSLLFSHASFLRLCDYDLYVNMCTDVYYKFSR